MLDRQGRRAWMRGDSSHAAAPVGPEGPTREQARECGSGGRLATPPMHKRCKRRGCLRFALMARARASIHRASVLSRARRRSDGDAGANAA